MKIAIVGTGIAGNVAAYKLHREHNITVFESNNYIGGHTHTHDIELDGESHKIDTGFIVFNHWTYPNFISLLNEIGVEKQQSNMSFSVKCEKSGLEYNGTTLNSLFAQRRNLFRPSFYRMVKDILRFNKEAANFIKTNNNSITLGEFLETKSYSQIFIDHYIIPMGAAIWSADPAQMFEFPARFFIQFFNNHGMLSVDKRPTWHVIKNGSNAYIEKLTSGFKDRIRLNTPIQSIRRTSQYVEIIPFNGEPEKFDQVFIACHSNQALKMLQDPSDIECKVLKAIPYQNNDVILHTDDTILPKRRLAWAAWNYHIRPQETGRVALTYNMNILQGIKSKRTFCVTLNHSEAINPDKIIKRLQYDHPIFTREGVIAQQRQKEINGVNRTYFCGAYWRNGFHEDGVVSALNAVDHLRTESKHEKLHLRRAS